MSDEARRCRRWKSSTVPRPRGARSSPATLCLPRWSCAGVLDDGASLLLVAGRGPWIDGAVSHRPVRIGYDERLIVGQCRAKTVARRTRAARIVERKQLRCGHRGPRPVIRTLESIGKTQLGDCGAISRRAQMRRWHDRVGKQQQHIPISFAERGLDRLGDAAALRFTAAEPVDDDRQGRVGGEVDLGVAVGGTGSPCHVTTTTPDVPGRPRP